MLYNLPDELIRRFREQLTLIDLQFEAEPAVIRQAVWSCYQEGPVEFRGHSLYDPGAFSEAPLSGNITWRVTQPWAEPSDEKERKALVKLKDFMERLRKKPGQE